MENQVFMDELSAKISMEDVIALFKNCTEKKKAKTIPDDIIAKPYPDNVLAPAEEKQSIYNVYRGVPFIEKFENLRKFEQYKEEARAKGLKEWEAFL